MVRQETRSETLINISVFASPGFTASSSFPCHFILAHGSVDRVFAVSCLPEVSDMGKVVEECRRILKPDGLICLNEWVVDPDYRLRSAEKPWARKAGVELKQEFGSWVSHRLYFGKTGT